MVSKTHDSNVDIAQPYKQFASFDYKALEDAARNNISICIKKSVNFA